MARPLRVEFKNALYHITARGIERKIIFSDRYDRNKFLYYLKENLQRYRVLLYAYVLMDNHYHFLVETLLPNLNRFMHDLNTAYSVYYNRRLNRVGPLFQGRYKSILVDKESYLLELSRYIHLNPVRSGKVEKPESYVWGSYRSYLWLDKKDWIDLKWVKERFGSRWKKRYKEFVEEGLSRPSPFEKVKAGFILGSGSFVEYVKEQISTKSRTTEVPSLKRLRNPTIDEIVEKTCTYFHVDEEEILKRRRNCLPRKIALYLAREYSCERIGNIAKKFNISYPAVSKAVERIKAEIKVKKELKRNIQKIIAL